MIRPVVVGTVVAVDSGVAEFKDRTSGKSEESVRCAMDLLCTKPEKGVLRVRCFFPYGKSVADCQNGLAALKALEGKAVTVKLSSFAITSNSPVAGAQVEDIVAA